MLSPNAGHQLTSPRDLKLSHSERNLRMLREKMPASPHLHIRAAWMLASDVGTVLVSVGRLNVGSVTFDDGKVM